jgi:hypothetical protein
MEVVNLHDALVALAGFEGDEVSIDMNGDTVKPLAYPWFGPKSHVEPPAFLNFWSFNAERRPPNRTRILDYSILVQLFVAPWSEDADWSAEACALFQNAVIDMFNRHTTLGENVSLTHVRGIPGEYQPIDLQWNDEHYIGLQFIVDCEIHEPMPAVGA